MTVLIAREVLERARAFFEDQGAIGCEGTAMIAASMDRAAERLIVPDQVSTPPPAVFGGGDRSGQAGARRSPER